MLFATYVGQVGVGIEDVADLIAVLRDNTIEANLDHALLEGSAVDAKVGRRVAAKDPARNVGSDERDQTHHDRRDDHAKGAHGELDLHT